MLKKIDTSAGKATCHHICGCKWVGSMITLDIRKYDNLRYPEIKDMHRKGENVNK